MGQPNRARQKVVFRWQANRKLESNFDSTNFDGTNGTISARRAIVLMTEYFKRECSRTWVKVGMASDEADPEFINDTITGEARVELTLANLKVAVEGE